MPFRQKLKALVNGVFGPLAPRDGVPDIELARAQERLGVVLPATLKEYYHLAGRHRQVSEGMNHILKPPALYIHSNALVFEEENQQYYFSGIRIDCVRRDDPPVMQGNRDESTWYPESKRLSDYLLCLICWQACNVRPSICVALSSDRLRVLKRHMDWANFGVDPRNDTIGLWGAGVCIAAFPKRREAYISARSEGLLQEFVRRFRLHGSR